MPTGGHVELPTVPGTGDGATVQLPLGQRTARMRTDAIQRKELLVDMKQRNDVATDDELAPLTNGHV